MDRDNHKSLTMYEYEGLTSREINLTDAHARYHPHGSQLDIMQNLVGLWQQSINTPYDDLAHLFMDEFYLLGRQDTARILPRTAMLCYSASQCIQIVASFIRSQGFRVALLEPSFDNVTGFLRSEEIDLVPLREKDLCDIDAYLAARKVNVVWVTLPNNPTGTILSPEDFRHLAEVCCANKVLLVTDFCFRLYSLNMLWDQYKVLEETGVQYAIIEDTGKTWPTVDQKIGMLQSSADIYDALYRYYDNYTVGMSSLTLTLVTAFVQDTRKHGIKETVYKVVQANRELLMATIRDTFLCDDRQDDMMPIAWLRITDPELTGSKVREMCKQVGVHILPGSNFYWHQPANGDKYVRVSLVRDTDQVREGMNRLRRVLAARSRSDEYFGLSELQHTARSL